MNFSTARSERITAIVSTLVAVAILAGGVTAYQSQHAPVDDVVQLESDLRFQLEVAFRHDPNERIARLEQLQHATQAWLQSPRDDADRQLLAGWLLEATIRSMPGSIEKLPEIPSFGEQTPPPTAEPRPDVRVTPPLDEASSDMVQQVPTAAAPVANVVSPSGQVAAPRTADLESSVLFEQPAAAPPGQPQPTAVIAHAAEPVRVNLPELAARIAGYHEGLNEIETALLGLDAADFQAVADQIRQLEELTRDFQFIQMYYAILTDEERRAVTPPRPLTATLAEIGRRLDRSQATQSRDYLEEFDSSQQAQIAELRLQLSEVARRIDR